MTSKIIYKQNLRTLCVHSKSGAEIITDAPIDNKGKGKAFSPTDLVATSLGSCMLTIIGIKIEENKLDIPEASIEITKIMGVNPRRITEIKVLINIKGNLSEKEKQIIQRAALACPVAKSLHPEINQSVCWEYQ